MFGRKWDNPSDPRPGKCIVRSAAREVHWIAGFKATCENLVGPVGRIIIDPKHSVGPRTQACMMKQGEEIEP